LFLLVGISCTDHSNGYCALFHLIGISCTEPFGWSVHEIPIRGNNVE
jgi:hypothetical protein